jgi:hypothetical protein
MMIQRGKSCSQDLRDRVLAADDLPARGAASRFSVSPSYVIKARQRRDRSGVLTIKPRRTSAGRLWSPGSSVTSKWR